MIKRRCKTFGCVNLHHNKRGYCDACIRKTGESFTDNRESSTARGYDNRWRVFSQNYLKSHPVCAVCGAPATVTDHKDTPAPIMLDLYGRFDLNPDNYQPLCVSCNTRKGYEDKKRVDEYFQKKALGLPRGEGQKNRNFFTTARVCSVHTHGEKHKGVPADGQEK